MNRPIDPDLQIMLIDYDKHVRESLTVFFESEAQRFLIFKSASEGLNSLKYQKIDIVIADYFLPDMDGLTFLKKVRENSPDTIRILMATIANDALKKDIRLAGIDRFLEKPLTIASLDTVLCELNRQFQTQYLQNRSDCEEKNE